MSRFQNCPWMEQHLKEILRFFNAAGAGGHHCISKQALWLRLQLKIIVKSCAVFDTIEIYRNKHMNEDIECEFLVMYKDERNRQTT